jgi:exonuclease SbcC
VTELGECPTCLQVVPISHKENIKRETMDAVGHLEEERAVLEESLRKVVEQLEKVERKIETASAADRKYAETIAQIKMLESLREEIKGVDARIEEIQLEIKENMDRATMIKDTVETLEEVTAKLMNVTYKAYLAREAEKQMAAKKDLDTMLLHEEENLKSLKLQLTELRASRKELAEKYNEKEHVEAGDTVRMLREDRAKKGEGVKRLSKSMEDDAFQISRAGKQLEEKRKAWKKVEKLKIENKVIEALRNSLREAVQPVMRKNNVLKVSEDFQAFYQELSNDNIDYAAIDEEANVDVIRNGEQSPINSLSGGETTCAALALRLAICSSLTKNQLLLLDEPTVHLDEPYRAKLRDFLGNHDFEQLIVVTHDNTFDSLPARIFRVEKKRGESIVSPLNPLEETKCLT